MNTNAISIELLNGLYRQRMSGKAHQKIEWDRDMLRTRDKSIHRLFRGLEAGCQYLGLTPGENIRQFPHQGKPVTQLFCSTINVHCDISRSRLSRDQRLGGVKDGRRMVPCLYDHDLQAKPGPMREVFVDALIHMGFWDPMSCHYYQWGVPPMGISSWTRIRLGWMDPSRIKVVKPGESLECTLSPLAGTSGDTAVIKIPLSDSTYYLLENRQPVGSDRNLPGSGVLIMYADDRIAECRRGESPVKLVNADPSAPHLEGAAFDVGKKSVFEDRKNRIRIAIKEKAGSDYRIRIE